MPVATKASPLSVSSLLGLLVARALLTHMLVTRMLVTSMLVPVVTVCVHPGRGSGFSTTRLARVATTGAPGPDLDPIVPQDEIGFAREWHRGAQVV